MGLAGGTGTSLSGKKPGSWSWGSRAAGRVWVSTRGGEGAREVTASPRPQGRQSRGMGQGPGTSRGWSPIGGVQRAKVLFPEGPSLAPGWAAEGLWGARHQPCSGPHGGLWGARHQPCSGPHGGSVGSPAPAVLWTPRGSVGRGISPGAAARRSPASAGRALGCGAPGGPGPEDSLPDGSGALSTGQGSDVGPPPRICPAGRALRGI